MTMMSEDDRETFSQYLRTLIEVSLMDGGTITLTVDNKRSSIGGYNFSVKKPSGETVLSTAVEGNTYREFVQQICTIISAEKELRQ